MTFDLCTLPGLSSGDVKKELRSHLANVLLIRTRGAASDLLMSVDDQEDGRKMFMVLAGEYGGKYDDDAVAMAVLDAMALSTHMGLGPFRADWQKNDRAYLDSTGFAVPLAMQRRQFLEAMRTHAHATTRDPPRGHEALAGLHSALMAKTLRTHAHATTRDPLRGHEALAGLHSALMAKTLTPGPMLGELTTACNALTASGVDVFAGNKVGSDLVLSAATARGMRTCESCNGCGTAEATAHNTIGRYDRRNRGDRDGRANSDSNW